jgi:hypothetical protein
MTCLRVPCSTGLETPPVRGKGRLVAAPEFKGQRTHGRSWRETKGVVGPLLVSPAAPPDPQRGWLRRITDAREEKP